MSDKISMPSTSEQESELAAAFGTIARIAGKMNAPMLCIMIHDSSAHPDDPTKGSVRVYLAGNFQPGHREFLASVGTQSAAVLYETARAAAPLFKSSEFRKAGE